MAQPLAVRLRPRVWSSEKTPDFLIVGLEKAGTYWLTSLLDLHPRISCIPARPDDGLPEVHFFDRLACIDTNRPRYEEYFRRKCHGFFSDLPRLADRVDRRALLERFRLRYNAYLQHLKSPDSDLVGEKTPAYVFHLDLIDSMYPGIRKVCILREHQDRIVSAHHMHRRRGRLAHEGIADDEVRSYSEHIGREYRALLDYRGALHLLTYERLSRETDRELSALLRFLGVSPAPGQVRAMIDGAGFERMTGRTRGTADDSSHLRSGVIGGGASELSGAQASCVHETLDDLTRDVMRRFDLDLHAYLAA